MSESSLCPWRERRAISVAEFCRAVGVSRQFCYDLLRSGKLHSKLEGRRRFILTDSIETWLRNDQTD